MTIPALSYHAQCMQEAMADKVARALNLLGADRDLFNSADGDAFLDLIDEYLDDPDGMPHPSSKPFNYDFSDCHSTLPQQSLIKKITEIYVYYLL